MGVGPVNPKVKLDQFGGINVGDHESKIGLGMFTVLENVDRSVAELRTRLGAEYYLNCPEDDTMGGVRNMYRYRASNGDKSVLAYDGVNVFTDVDNGEFTSVTSFTPNADGNIDFAQYRDTVFLASETRDLKCYNSIHSPVSITPSMAPKNFPMNTIEIHDTCNTLDSDLIYYWRWTFDIQIGTDFMGETGAAGAYGAYHYARFDTSKPDLQTEASIVVAAGGAGYAVGDIIKLAGGTPRVANNETRIFVTEVSAGAVTQARRVTADDAWNIPGFYSVVPANPVAQASTSGAGAGATFTMTWKEANANSISLRRPADGVVTAIPTYCSRINFYRSPGYTSAADPGPEASVESTEYYYVGSVAMTAVIAQTAGLGIFLDTGLPLGKRISYGLYNYAIRPRYACVHKGRLWGAYVALAPNETGTYKTYPDSIVYSRFFSNGEEPLAFQLAAPKVTLDHYTGEGITALGSWRGKVLVVCKPNSTHAIIGADDNISETIPNIQHDTLSSTLGCIAPRSFIDAGDALMWLSNEGPVYFDGRGVQTLEVHQVKPILDAIPADKRRLSHSVYDTTTQEWYLFFYRGKALRFSFKTRLWTMDVYQCNIGAALEIRDSDGSVRILRGIDEDAAIIELIDQPLIETANIGFVNSSTSQFIPWRAHTGSDDFKIPNDTKEIIGVTVDGEWYDDVKIDLEFVGAEGVGIDTAALAETLTFTPPTGGKGVKYQPFKDNKAYTGKRVKIKMHGDNVNGRTQIASVSLYAPQRGERSEDRV